MGVSNMTLVKIAAFGGLATCSMGLALRSKMNQRVKDTVYYKEALKTLRENKAAVHLLGEPIRDGTINVGDSENNYTKDYEARYEVRIRAPKQNGTMYFWAEKNDLGQWFVHRIELGLDNEPNRRLLVKKSD